MREERNDILIYKTEDGKTDITVRVEKEDVWLNQQQMAELYQTSRTNVVEHIKHIYEEEELAEEATCRKFRQVQTEGGRSVEREMPMKIPNSLLPISPQPSAISRPKGRSPE